MKRLMVVLAVTALAITTPGVAHGRARVSDVGWWSRNPGALPASGGFDLGWAPDGPISIAALRIDVTAPVVAAELTIIESNGFGQDTASIDICPASNDWEAADPGPYADAPDSNCAGLSIAMERDATFSTWSADITPMLVGGVGERTVLLVPGDADPPFGYQISFTGVALDAVTVDGPSSTPIPTLAPPPPVFAPVIPPTALFEPQTGPPPTLPPTLPPSAPPAPVLGADVDLTTDSPSEPQPWWRLVIVVPLAGLLGGAWVFSRRLLLARGMLGD